MLKDLTKEEWESAYVIGSMCPKEGYMLSWAEET